MVLATVSPPCSRWSALIAIGRVHWPAFNSSNQLHALTTVGQVVAWRTSRCGLLWRRGRRVIAGCASVIFLSAFVGRHARQCHSAPPGCTCTASPSTSSSAPIPDPADRLPGPARHDVCRAAAVLSGRLVLARRPGRRADRHAGWEMFKPWAITSIAVAVVTGVRVVVGDDPLRVRADRHDRHRRGDAGLLVRRALRRRHHRAAAAGAGAGVVRAARPDRAAGGWARGRRGARRSSSASPRCSTPCCWPTPRSPWRVMAVSLALARRSARAAAAARGDRA